MPSRPLAVECCSFCGHAVADVGTETRWQCETCGETHGTEEDAEECTHGT